MGKLGKEVKGAVNKAAKNKGPGGKSSGKTSSKKGGALGPIRSREPRENSRNRRRQRYRRSYQAAGLRDSGLSFASTRDHAVLLPFYHLFRRVAKRPASLELQPSLVASYSVLRLVPVIFLFAGRHHGQDTHLLARCVCFERHVDPL